MTYCLVETTCSNIEQARNLAQIVLDKKLAACVHYWPIGSSYIWKGKLEHDNEVKLSLKTKKDLYSRLETLISQHHPYEVPEIIMVPIEGGSKSYLNWLEENTLS